MKFSIILRMLLVIVIGATGIIGALSSATANQASPSASPSAGVESIEIRGEVANPGIVTLADAQALPAETVDVTYLMDDGSEEAHTYTGAHLWDVLQLAEPLIDADLPETSLSMYIVLTAADGYVVVLSLGEIDPEFGGYPYLLAWDQDGQPLSSERGPLMLVPSGDRSEGRYIYSLVSIEVRTITTPSGG
jgi:DMSO/TMAO reductase YedYZ molybdopterin-dependent catalytic subunit